jgi:competence protein ComEC
VSFAWFSFHRHTAVVGIALSLCLPSAIGANPPLADKQETRWTMVNVSPAEEQADCHLIEFPDGRKALIDIADAADAAGTALAYLQSHKITKIDLVVISHFHRDHYGRLMDLIEAGIRIGRVAINLPAPDNKIADEEMPWGFDRAHVESVLQYLREKKIPYFTPLAGERLMEVPIANGLTVSLDVVCLYDGMHTPVGATDVNDTSIIVRLSHGATRALFTGDLNQKLGAYLAGSDFDLAADVLKVPHHGTIGCAPDEFFAKVNPKAALVPSPRTLWLSPRSKPIRDFFSAHNIPTYVSGIHGHVTVIMTAQGFTIETERAGN